jgi:hypothetical protein
MLDKTLDKTTEAQTPETDELFEMLDAVTGGSYISYGAMQYYSGNSGGNSQANNYSRGCSAITRCRG